MFLRENFFKSGECIDDFIDYRIVIYHESYVIEGVLKIADSERPDNSYPYKLEEARKYLRDGLLCNDLNYKNSTHRVPSYGAYGGNSWGLNKNAYLLEYETICKELV